MSKNKNLTIKEIFGRAVKNHQEGKTDIAQDLYNQVLKIDPNYSPALNNIAVIFSNLKEHQKAKDCYEKAIAIDPNYAAAHNNLGIIFKELRENQKAKECYEKAISIDPNYANAHNNLGIIFKELRENQKAKDCYEKAIAIDPNYAAAHNNLGSIFKELGEYQKAKECYEKVIEIDPNFIEAHNNLGNVFKDLGNLQKAKECYEKAISIDPNYVDVHDNLNLLLKIKRLLSKIEQARKSEIKTKIDFFKKVPTKLSSSDLRLTSNPFISNMKVEAKLVSQLYKIKSKKLDDVDLEYLLRYGNGRSSNDKLFESNFSTIKTVAKDLVNIMKEAVKSDIFIMDSFFNIFQTESGIISHNHVNRFDYNYGLLNQKFSLTYYLDIGDQNCSEPGILKLQDPDREILPSEGMIVIFPASRKHSATYGGKKDRVMIGVNFYSLI